MHRVAQRAIRPHGATQYSIASVGAEVILSLVQDFCLRLSKRTTRAKLYDLHGQ